ncbi:MAG TPA: hypothetical protein VMT24_20125 [Aggregatilineaceae bacterium]|nr:hypothetical protein [Aggregatilineaceae bacterium]
MPRYFSSHRLKAVLVLAVLAAMVILPLASTQAQIGGTIGYGSSVFGTLSAVGQSLTYSFNGNAGDLVQTTVRNWTGTLDPQLGLVAPDGQTVASSSSNPFGEDNLAASLSLLLPQTGIYSLLVSGENGTTGDFVLKLQGRGAVAATPLVYGQNVDVSVPQNPQPQYFSFDAQDCRTVFTVANLSEGQPFTFPFVVKVRDSQGTQIAQLYGGDALEDRLILAPNSGRYEVTVSSDDPQAQDTIRLLVTCSDQAPGCIPGSLSGGTGVGAGGCPSCFGEGECSTFVVTATLDGNTASFTWPPVEGAEYYIFSLIDSSGALLLDSAVALEGVTSHTYTFLDEDVSRGPFTAIVNAGNVAEGYLCTDNVLVSLEGQTTDQCPGIKVSANIIPGADRMAVLEWSPAPSAAAYMIHVYAYGEDGGLIGIRVFTAPGDATTYHLDGVFPSDYERFRIEVRAYSTASGGGAFGDMPQGYLCSGGTDVEFESSGAVHWGPAS